MTMGGDASISAETVTDAALRGLVGYNMRRALNAVQADLVRTLEPLGLRVATFSALVLVQANPGLRQTQLAHLLGIERSNLVTILDDLERRGAVRRSPVADDRRAHALAVTRAGAELATRAMQAVQAHEDRVLRRLTGQRRGLLIADLQLIESTAKGASHG